MSTQRACSDLRPLPQQGGRRATHFNRSPRSLIRGWRALNTITESYTNRGRAQIPFTLPALACESMIHGSRRRSDPCPRP